MRRALWGRFHGREALYQPGLQQLDLYVRKKKNFYQVSAAVILGLCYSQLNLILTDTTTIPQEQWQKNICYVSIT